MELLGLHSLLDYFQLLLMFIYASDQSLNQDNFTPPGLFREVFYSKYDIQSIDTLKSYPNYPKNPDSYEIIDVFAAPQNVGDFYGQRIRGWFLAPETGNYTFYSSCDEFCELYLSNDTNSKNKVLIINQTVYSGYNTFNAFSANIHLKANNKYYIEALMVEIKEADHLSIAVHIETGLMFSLQPIPVNMLSTIRMEYCTSDCVRYENETCMFESNSFGICTCIYGQKVVNNQVICQDAIETATEYVFISFEIPLLRNTIVTTLIELGQEFTVSFDVYPTSFSDHWANVIHLTISGHNEDRNLVAFFQPSSNILQIASISNITILRFNTPPIPLKQWSSIKISQQLVNESCIFYICVNGSVVYSVVNKTPVKLSNVKVYAADPWYVAQNGFIRNLIIISGSPAYVSPGLLREVYYNNNKSINSIDALKKNPKYSLTPDSYGIIGMFDTPQNFSDFYGQRVRGWFLAPQTGNYTFYSSCDDLCELFLSNDSDPKNKRLIINQTTYSRYMQFNKTANQSSEMVFLKENCNYYIEALMSEITIDDHLSIGVITPYTKGGLMMVISNFLSPIRIETCISADCIRTVYEKCILENGFYAICTCINGQKIINNQIVCHDGMRIIQDSIIMEEEIPLIRNTYVATLSTLKKEYMLSFDVKPAAFYNVLAYDGYSNLDIQFTPLSEGSFGIWSSISSLVSSVFHTKQLPLMQWSSINITQVLVDDSYIYSVYLNETLFSSFVNMAPVVLSNVTVYAADSWCVALSGSIRNLIIISRAEWANWNNWSACNALNGTGLMNRTRLCNNQSILELCFGNSTEFSQCDKNCSELESVFLPNEMLLKKNNTVASLRKIYKEYIVSFDIKPISYNLGWHNVIHLTNLRNVDNYGDRIPAVFFNEDSSGTMQICSAVNGYTNYTFFTRSIPLMQWSALKISQELSNGSYVYSITLNGTIIHSVVNNQTIEVSNVEVYAGNPWLDSQPGFIRNFVIITGPSGISHQWSDWSSCNVSCGYGWRIRTQDYCLNDYWENSTTSKDLISCFSNDTCEVNWSQWSDWSKCNLSSGNGFMKRSRICNSTSTFEWCSGNSSEISACLNNILEFWGSWSGCDYSCGNGLKRRTKLCYSSSLALLCVGNDTDTTFIEDNKVVFNVCTRESNAGV